MPLPSMRSGLMPAARQYFLIRRQGVLRSMWRLSSASPSLVIGRNSGPWASSAMPAASIYANTARAASSKILRLFLLRFSVTCRKYSTPSCSRCPTHAAITAETRQPVIKNVEISAKSRFPINVSVGMTSNSAIACLEVSAGVVVLGDRWCLDRRNILGRVPTDETLFGELPVGTTQHREATGNRGRRDARFQERSLVEFEVVGVDREGIDDAQLAHVPHEVGQVPAVGLY